MDCARVDGELVGFQLAALDGATRAAVEAHLTGCARCVSAYLALKRALDASEDALAPSELVRARIRQQAVRQLASPPRASEAGKAGEAGKARWALAAAAAAALVLAPLWYRATRAPSPPPSATETAAPPVVPVRAVEDTVDTARTTPENLAFL